MIAVKYREDYLSLPTPFNWPNKVKKPVDTLPEGYDALLTQAEYDQLLLDNQSAFDDQKVIEQQQAALANAAGSFKRIRDKWQQLADEYAAENVGAGITTAQAKLVADSFNSVKYYLETNVPMQAIAELDNIPPAPFLDQAKIDSMKAEMLAFIQEVFNIGA